MKRLTILAMVLVPIASFCQTNIISGKIISENGNPIPSATITLLRTKAVTLSDKQGLFAIENVVVTDTILITGINYEPVKYPVNGQQEVTITMRQKAVTLGEVVVNTGYQELNKERSAGSFEKVDSSLFNRRISPDILGRLDGSISNLFFSRTGSEPILYMRGLSSLQSATQPLIIVDNFPYEGNLSNLNPNDVATVTVLKDASAASIWGSRAGNGVIVITTKRGQFSRPLRVSLTSNVTLQGKPRLLDDPGFMTAPGFIETERFLFDQGYYHDQAAFPAYYILSPVVELLYKQTAGEISQQEADKQIAALSTHDVRRDYLRYLYRNPVSLQNFISLTAGNKQLSWLLNIGYDNNLSNFVRESNRRYTINSMTNLKPTPKIDIGIGLNVSITNANYNGLSQIAPGGGKSTLYPYAHLTDNDGRPLSIERDYRNSYTDTAGNGLLLDWKYRPLDELTLNNNWSKGLNLLGRINIRYKITPFLFAEAKAQLENSRNNSEFNNSVSSYYSRNMINLYSTINGNTIKRNIPIGDILDISQSNLNAWNARAQLNFDKSLDKQHSVTMIGGAELREVSNKLRQSRIYGYNSDILTYSNVDYLTQFPLYGNLGNSAIPNGINLAETKSRFVSLFSNAAYSYLKRYTLNLSVRKDASNIFGVSTNQKWEPLWSAGIAWKLSDEPFYKLNCLPVLNIRLTNGYSGNVNSSVSAAAIIQYLPATSPTNLPYASLRTSPNPELRWERNQMRNIGLDFSLKGDRIAGSIDFYVKKVTDLISTAPVDPTVGVNTLTLNAAALKGKGLDIRINTRLVDKGIKWNSLLLFSYVSNKVEHYLLESANKGSYAGNGYSISPLEGKDPYSLISYRWGGLDPDTGNPIGFVAGQQSQNYASIVNATSWDDLVFKGTTRPPFFGNWIHTFSWKGISVSAGFSFRFKYYFRRNTINYSSLFSNWIGHNDYTKRWMKKGDEQYTSVPSLPYPANSNRDKFYAYSEATIEKGDLIRWQDLNISWNIPLSEKGRRAIKALQIYGACNNIGLLWRANKAGLDPDFGNNIPPSPSFSIGIKTDF
ncbi:MAG: SusC/RagA family TonB-linked outer membrane protein [Chitinophagaceae bacterium]|nr:SusC/RagA family TonB-linked outer membrane protein [Chitinophagaceae bacterium]